MFFLVEMALTRSTYRLCPLVAATCLTCFVVGLSTLAQTKPDQRSGSSPQQAPPLRPFHQIVFSHGSRTIKEVALTFDACATRQPSGYDERVTQILLETQTPATIFLGGKWMEEHPEQTKLLESTPLFELGNHSYLHPHMREASDERIRKELCRTQDVMYAMTGRQPTLFRPPYGEHDDRIVRIAAAMGLTTVEYDLPSGDPSPEATKEKLIEYVTTMARSGSIIVMHINGRGWHTAEALPDIIARLRKRGFVFVTVTQLLQHSSPATEQK
jgi:peptidoglycan/xylan/chitin deacetylase (PgdA/CDA1 family)